MSKFIKDIELLKAAQEQAKQARESAILASLLIVFSSEMSIYAGAMLKMADIGYKSARETLKEAYGYREIANASIH